MVRLNTSLPGCDSTPVTKDNVKSTVIAEKWVTPAELCEGPFAAACKEAGISG